MEYEIIVKYKDLVIWQQRFSSIKELKRAVKKWER